MQFLHLVEASVSRDDLLSLSLFLSYFTITI